MAARKQSSIITFTCPLPGHTFELFENESRASGTTEEKREDAARGAQRGGVKSENENEAVRVREDSCAKKKWRTWALYRGVRVSDDDKSITTNCNK